MAEYVTLGGKPPPDGDHYNLEHEEMGDSLRILYRACSAASDNFEFHRIDIEAHKLDIHDMRTWYQVMAATKTVGDRLAGRII